MNIKDILKTVGTAVLASTPLGAAALPVINAFLPEDNKLPETATAEEAEAAINGLPPEEQSKLYLADVQLKIEEEKGRTARYVAMAQADGQETRAKIVNRAMTALMWLSLIFIAAVAYVYSTSGAEVAFSYEMAAVYLTVSGTFAYVVRAYFGDLRSETQSRHQAVDDKPQPLKGLAGLINTIRK